MATEKTVEDRIREHYCADNGEWLVEKGKLKEARLLKEAYHRIHSLKNDVSNIWNDYRREYEKRIELERSLLEREKALTALEAQFAQRIETFKNTIDSWLK